MAIVPTGRYGRAPMVVCATCGSRWDEQTLTRLAAADCPVCEGELVEVDEAPLDAAEPVHADVGRVLCEHLLGVGA